MERIRIPVDFPFEEVGAISAEAREKLSRFKPETLGQASRIAGVRAADLSILMVLLERRRRSGEEGGDSLPNKPEGEI
jgi:tRNA uridine 5-carboxymethylaminomethyl modification enzyme